MERRPLTPKKNQAVSSLRIISENSRRTSVLGAQPQPPRLHYVYGTDNEGVFGRNS